MKNGRFSDARIIRMIRAYEARAFHGGNLSQHGLATRPGETGGGVSDGEAGRLMLVRAVIEGGELILADEPTADLDAETAARIRAEARAILVATHDPMLAAAMDVELAMTS